ncbi:MAG: metallophosphoesterase [Oscillospiraceae bacterium]|nr:metallophosphoesterase [Oscillospiraceae bacterium]
MKIIVVSDSHKDFHALYNTFDQNLDADLFVFLGDGIEELEDMQSIFFQKDIWSVCGNCDFFTTKDTIGTGVVQGLKILYTHGHLYEVKKGMFKLSRKATDENANIVLFGHTHERFCAEQDGILYFNPGSISVPRGCKIPTYGEIIIEDGKIASYRHVELT